MGYGIQIFMSRVAAQNFPWHWEEFSNRFMIKGKWKPTLQILHDY